MLTLQVAPHPASWRCTLPQQARSTVELTLVGSLNRKETAIPASRFSNPSPAPVNEPSAQPVEHSKGPVGRWAHGALGWAQLAASLLCVAIGAVIGLTGHTALGVAIAGAGGLTLTVNIQR